MPLHDTCVDPWMHRGCTWRAARLLTPSKQAHAPEDDVWAAGRPQGLGDVLLDLPHHGFMTGSSGAAGWQWIGQHIDQAVGQIPLVPLKAC